MAVDPENAIVLYPEYFDLKVSRASGRRVAKRDAIEAPNAHGLYEAVKAMGYDCILELEKAHPRFWFKSTGRVLVENKLRKTQLIENVAKKLKSMPPRKEQ